MLLAPQGVVISVFFFWPAGQAMLQSLQQSGRLRHVGRVGRARQLQALWNDPNYLASFETTAVFSVLVAGLGIGISLLLAVFADRVVRGAAVYKTLLIWPYAVAPAVAGVLWLFMFSPSIGIALVLAARDRRELEQLAQQPPRHGADRDGRGLEADLVQLPVLPSGPRRAFPKSLIEAAAIDGARPWRRFWSIQVPLLSPTTFFLLVINIVYAFFDTFGDRRRGDPGRPRKDTSILVYKVCSEASRRSTSAARRRSRWC